MADLTSLYKNKPKRDFSIQACADCINKIALQFTEEFKKGFFTDYFDIAGGTQPPKSAFINEPSDGYIKFLQIRDFSSDSTPTFIPISKKNKICSEEDLVLGRYGASVGKILTGKSGAYNVACAKIIFLKEDSIDREFLFYWLHSSYFQDFLKSISRSAQGGFNKNDLSRIKTYFPKIDIQRKLTSILKTIDLALLNGNEITFVKKDKTEIENAFIELVEKFLSFTNEGEQLSTELSHQLDLVKKLRQQFLQEAVQGKLVPQNSNDEPASELLKKIKAEKQKLISEGKLKKEKELPPIKVEEIPFEIPEGWVWCRLGEIFKFIDYRGKTPTRVNEGVRLISAKNIRFGYINDNPVEYISSSQYDKWMVRGLPRNGDILFVTEGHTMGFVAIINLNFKYVLAQRTICLQPPIYEYSKFLFFSLMSPYIQSIIRNLATGAAAMGVKSSKLKELSVPLPPLSEQHRIVQKLDELMQTCDALEASIKESASQNEKLLQQVLREALRKEDVEL